MIKKLNPQALSRILSNIVSNVIKYSEGNLKITLQENGTILFENPTSRMDGILAFSCYIEILI
ncbi:MAG: hypothetical protein PUA75_04710 [Clostridiales bacterium]|nr:hypothetical protein [Clostridiales bacterium]